jgi:uncharacterized protein YehS (DUF1456 family)
MGARSFLYFTFNQRSGYASVREYADPSRADNPTRIYTWLKKESDTMCQHCSDREVALTHHALHFLSRSTPIINGNVRSDL